MKALNLISNPELLALMPRLVRAERDCMADVIEHLVEIKRRELFLKEACPSLRSYCIERLGYSDDEAGRRVRVARLANRFPLVIDELRAGTMHLTGLFLLEPHLTEENWEPLFAEARGKSKSEITVLIADWFPKPDVPDRLCELPDPALTGPACPGTGPVLPEIGRVEPLSECRFSVEFTASAELARKIEHAKELLSHAVPSGDLATVFDDPGKSPTGGRALDELIERETKRRLGAGKPRKRRPLAAGSRHVPVEIARAGVGAGRRPVYFH
jgi:hypothetical protein